MLTRRSAGAGQGGRTAEPLPLPGQLKPVDDEQGEARAGRSDGARSTGQRRRAHAAGARRLHQRDAGLSVHEGALYQVYAAPGQITDIALQPGEQLVGSGPVAAGDTVRWIIGDTESGAGGRQQVHILVKPTRADLQTNLVINTDRRTYHLELRSTETTYMASVSWQYPQDQLIALAPAERAGRRPRSRSPPASISPKLNFRYRDRGRPRAVAAAARLRRRRQVFIEFPRASARAKCRRCSSSARRANSELVNYRVRANT